MKALTLLPKEIKSRYLIIRQKDCVEVHVPSYINIDFDERFCVESNETVHMIKNSKVCVTLWNDVDYMHVTVYSK